MEGRENFDAMLDQHGGSSRDRPGEEARRSLRERLARRRRHDGVAIAVIASLAVLVAGTGIASLGDGRGGRAVAGRDADPTAISPDAGATAAPQAPATPAQEPAGSPPQVTRPSAPPSSRASPEPAPPPAPSSTRASGEDGLRIEVGLSATNPTTASLTDLTVEAADDDGRPQVAKVTWGDGSGEEIGTTAVACAAPVSPPPADDKDPGSSRATYRHAWRHPGTYAVVVGVTSSVYCDSSVPREYAEVRLTVHVRPGPDVTNGPAAPEARHATYGRMTDGRPREVTAAAYLTDPDGCVVDATLDWGDGTVDRLEEPEECTDGGGRHYPRGYGIGWEKRHTYATPGRYLVTFGVTSAGVGGGDVQHTTVTLTVYAN